MNDITKSDVVVREHYALDAERAVLTAILHDVNEYDKLNGILLAKFFYKSAHQLIFSSLEFLIESNKLGINELKKHLLENGQLEECGGDEFLKQLKNYNYHPMDIREQGGIIRSKYSSRKILSIYGEIVSKIDSGEDIVTEFYEAGDRAEHLFNDLNPNPPPNMLGRVIANVYSALQDNYQRPEFMRDVYTGYKDIDDMTHGLQRGDLIVVGARSHVLKTSWLINLAHNIAIHGKDSKVVAFFTLGMSAEDLGMRMLSMESRVGIRELYSGQFTANDWRKLAIASGSLADANIYIEDRYCSSVRELLKKCQWIKRESKGLDLVLVDYLQLIGGKKCVESREQQEIDIMHALKNLAKALDVPVVIASQLSIGLETGGNNRPMLQDFHEVFAIEEYADVVMFICHDEIYYEKSNGEGNAEVIIAKNNRGITGPVKLTFFNQYARFESLVDRLDEQFIYDQYTNGEVE